MIGNINNNKSLVRIGAISPSYDIQGLIKFYKTGIKQRQMTPDDRTESKFNACAITERYFDFGMIKND